MPLILTITPFVRTAVLQPENTGRDIGRVILAVARKAQCPIIQTLHNPFICRRFAAFKG
jgi:hypothetical protein